MAFTIRNQIARRAGRPSATRAQELVAGALLVAVSGSLAMRTVLPADALAPAVATLLFGLGGGIAGCALVCRRRQAIMMWLDIAGVLTFVGVVVAALIEPDQMVRLVTLSDQPD